MYTECYLPTLGALFFFKVLAQLIFTEFLVIDTLIISFYKWELRLGKINNLPEIMQQRQQFSSERVSHSTYTQFLGQKTRLAASMVGWKLSLWSHLLWSSSVTLTLLYAAHHCPQSTPIGTAGHAQRLKHGLPWLIKHALLPLHTCYKTAPSMRVSNCSNTGWKIEIQ